MATQKGKKTKSNGLQESGQSKLDGEQNIPGEIRSNAELKTFLQGLLDRMEDGQVAPIFAFSAVNHFLSKSDLYNLFCPETKELARDIWLRVKQSGLQVRNPVFLFGAEADAAI
jgi:hypothetical protein